MVEVITLIKITFDNLENNISDAIAKETIATFVDDTNMVAYYKLSKYLLTLPLEMLYLGHDGKIYPQWIVVKHFAK